MVRVARRVWALPGDNGACWSGLLGAAVALPPNPSVVGASHVGPPILVH